MGATHAGDIEHLCGIAPPEVGILTAISPVHLDSFGTLEGLAAAKGELAPRLARDRRPCLTLLARPRRRPGRGRTLGRRITFGREGAGADLSLRRSRNGARGSASWRSSGHRSSEGPLPRVRDAPGGAAARGHRRRARARPRPGRVRPRRSRACGGPASGRGVQAAATASSSTTTPTTPLQPPSPPCLRYGADQAARQDQPTRRRPRRHVRAGPCARAYHQEAGKLAAEVGVDLLVCVGDEARWYAEAFAGSHCSTTRPRRPPTAFATTFGPEITLWSRVREESGSIP